jgi:hypothetical protein
MEEIKRPMLRALSSSLANEGVTLALRGRQSGIITAANPIISEMFTMFEPKHC